MLPFVRQLSPPVPYYVRWGDSSLHWEGASSGRNSSPYQMMLSKGSLSDIVNTVYLPL